MYVCTCNLRVCVCVCVCVCSNYIVGFEVMPFSIKHSYYGKWNASAIPYHKLTTCSGDPPNGRFERHQPQVLCHVPRSLFFFSICVYVYISMYIDISIYL